MHEGLKRAVEAEISDPQVRDALLAAVELAEATRRHYEACGPGSKFSALQMSLMDAAKNERKA